MRDANALVKRYVMRNKRLKYVDVFNPMLGANGHPRPELFVDDSLHMSPAGYALWTHILQPVVKLEPFNSMVQSNESDQSLSQLRRQLRRRHEVLRKSSRRRASDADLQGSGSGNRAGRRESRSSRTTR